MTKTERIVDAHQIRFWCCRLQISVEIWRREMAAQIGVELLSGSAA
jgi:hypothetical protein